MAGALCMPAGMANRRRSLSTTAPRSGPMATFAKNSNLNRDLSKSPMRRASIAALGASVALFVAGTSAQEDGPAKRQIIPELASSQFGWLALGVDWLDPPPGLGHGPIRPDPAHPHVGNRDRGQVTLHIGNAKDP